MYCTQCGKPLSGDSLFCSQCGKRVMPPAQQPAPAPPYAPPVCQPAPPQYAPPPPLQTAPPMTAPAPPYAPPACQPATPQYAPPPPLQTAPSANGFTPADESAVWVFRTDRKLSILKQMPCYIVFKRDHLVLAHLSKEMMKAESARMQSEVKEQGLGFFKGSAAMMRGWAAYGEKYERMPTRDVLLEDAANMAVGYADIVRCLFRGYSTYSSGDDSADTVITGKLELSLRSGDTIKFTHRQSGSKAIKSTLQGLLGDRLKYKN